MLLVAETMDDELVDTLMSPGSPASRITAPVAGPRYGEGRRVNPYALAVATLVPALALAALIQAKIAAPEVSRERIAVVELSAAPPPPPPPPKQAPPPEQAAIAVPQPALTIPNPTPPVVAVVQPPEAVVSLAPAAVPAPPAPPAATPSPSTVETSDLGTRMISGEPPRYPTESRRKKEEGTVVLALTLDVTGKVNSISVVRSSGHGRLDDAALRAVRKWRWAPTLRDGRPVIVRGEVEIPFVLQG